MIPALALGMVSVLSVPTAALAAPDPAPAFTAFAALTESELTLTGPDAPITVPDSGSAEGLLDVQSAVGADIVTSPLTLTLQDVSGPGDIAVLAGAAPLVAAGDSTSLPATGEIPVEVVFSEPGEYRLALDASTTLTRPTTEESSEDVVAVTASPLTLEFRVDASPVDETANEQSVEETSEERAGEETASQPGDEEETPTLDVDPEGTGRDILSDASDVQVLSEGDVRLAYRLTDGELDLSLALADADTVEWHDLSSTIIHLPNQDETWPGSAFPEGNVGRTNWELLIAEDERPYRTVGRAAEIESAANALSLSWDASMIASSDLYGGINRELRGVTTDSGGYFASYGTAGNGRSTRQWDGRSPAPGAAPVWWQTSNGSATGGALAANPAPTGFLFSAPGIYCVTVGSTAHHADPWAGYASAAHTLTFAVGDVAPGAADLCGQPAPEPPVETVNDYPDGGGNVVLRAGDVRLVSEVDEGEADFSIVDRSSREDRTFDPSQVVFHLPNQDTVHPADTPYTGNRTQWEGVYPADSRYWRSDGMAADAYRPLETNPLNFAIDSNLIDRAQLQIPALHYQMTAAAGPGPMFSYSSGRSDALASGSTVPQWWSEVPPGTAGLNGPLFTGVGTSGSALAERRGGNLTPLGWAFAEAGQYCVQLDIVNTALADGTALDGSVVLTFVVGDELDPAEVVPCADVEDGGPGADDDTGVDGVNYLLRGHTDIGVAWADGGGIELYASDGVTHQNHSLDDTVMVGRTPFNRATVTPSTQFIGDLGSEYWFFSASPSFSAATVWPGFSSLELGGANVSGSVNWTMLGASGPGDVILYANNTTRGVYFNTKWGLPMGRDTHVMHEHTAWAFTEPGLYCLNLEVRVRDLDGAEHSADGQLTVAVGDGVRLAETTPCAWDTETPAPLGPLPDIAATDAEGEVLSADRFDLVPYLTNGELVAAASVRGPILHGEHRFLDPETVVVSGNTSQLTGAGRVWQIGPRHAWQHRYLDTDDIIGDPTLSLGEVDGPGDMWFARIEYGGNLAGNLADIGTRDGDPSSTSLWPGWENDVRTQFSAAGVYCVPLIWTAQLAGGGSTSVTKTLTYVVGATVPGSADYVDRSSVQLCADGGEGSDPGDGEEPGGEEPGAPEWDVPNGTLTESGATILNTGHVDIASLISGGVLDTKVKDTTESTTATWREPEETVLQLLPSSETVIESDAQAFLGPIGQPIWQVTETQQTGLLWPGWSTEEIPDAATSTGFDWRLNAVEGPGEFVLYASDPVDLGQSIVLFNTRDGLPDTTDIPKRIHAHGSWAFSAEGVYCLDFDRSTTLPSGEVASDRFTVTVAVGQVDVKGIDPADCFATPDDRPAEPDSTPIPVGDLNEANAGGVQVLGGADGFTAGQLVTVQVDQARAGQWVSVWVDDVSWLGWVQVGSSGAIQVRLPADAAVGSHVLVIKDRDGALIGWDSLSVIPADDPGDGSDPGGPGDPGEEPGPEPAPDAVWDVANGTVNEAGATVLNNGHVDIASLVEGRSLPTRMKDTTMSNDPTWRDPAETVLQLLPSSRTTVPQGSQWAFLGSPGSPFYQVAQRAQPGLLWPGWSTEEIPPSATREGVAWRLSDATGPGEFILYQTGAFGVPQVLFNTRDGITAADAFEIPKLTHAHGSWAFSAQGNYCLAFERSATLASGQAVSDGFVLAIAVGRADVMRVDPAACFTAPDDQPADPDRTPISEDDLTDANAGPVRVLDKAAGFISGQLVSVQAGAAHADEWMSVWLHSDPVWLGWVK
ncbi:MAG: TIGR03773 family transporter-associated surface protein, partial [Bifidobacteriaceae bacterium]|nr:TIGR03773 family transporter-associated surface protein [Bifidobacteriaceae bacterium]